MTRRSFDVDIDVCSSINREAYGTRAAIYNEETGRVLVHPSGVYIEPVPVDGMTGHAAFDYMRGDGVGLFKVDILTNTSYDAFVDKDDLLKNANIEPEWDLLKKRKVVEKLPHLSKHFDLVEKVAPTSIIELADCLALVRPGKTHLIDSYLENRTSTRRTLYQRPKEGIFFKKSHAVSYAMMIVAILNKTHATGIFW